MRKFHRIRTLTDFRRLELLHSLLQQLISIIRFSEISLPALFPVIVDLSDLWCKTNLIQTKRSAAMSDLFTPFHLEMRPSAWTKKLRALRKQQGRKFCSRVFNLRASSTKITLMQSKFSMVGLIHTTLRQLRLMTRRDIKLCQNGQSLNSLHSPCLWG
jgi:hypothetical protein